MPAPKPLACVHHLCRSAHMRSPPLRGPSSMGKPLDPPSPGSLKSHNAAHIQHCKKKNREKTKIAKNIRQLADYIKFLCHFHIQQDATRPLKMKEMQKKMENEKNVQMQVACNRGCSLFCWRKNFHFLQRILQDYLLRNTVHVLAMIHTFMTVGTFGEGSGLKSGLG